jgi:hypothetical protein
MGRDLGELTRLERLWLSTLSIKDGAIKGGILLIPTGSIQRLRRMDLITTRHDRSFALTRLGLALAQRLKHQVRLSSGGNAVLHGSP